MARAQSGSAILADAVFKRLQGNGLPMGAVHFPRSGGQAGGEFRQLCRIENCGERRALDIERDADLVGDRVVIDGDVTDRHAVAATSSQIGDSGEHPDCGMCGLCGGQKKAVIFATIDGVNSDLSLKAGNIRRTVHICNHCDFLPPKAVTMAGAISVSSHSAENAA
jgi:hypothetical protein